LPNKNVSDGNEHFILTFTTKNEAGALAQALNIIGAHNFNMRSLRSRPMKELIWNYYFYVEAEGNIATEDGQNMLKELSAICARLKLVGTYN
jgi:chorismate mutase/prephenate dehydratase